MKRCWKILSPRCVTARATRERKRKSHFPYSDLRTQTPPVSNPGDWLCFHIHPRNLPASESQSPASCDVDGTYVNPVLSTTKRSEKTRKITFRIGVFAENRSTPSPFVLVNPWILLRSVVITYVAKRFDCPNSVYSFYVFAKAKVDGFEKIQMYHQPISVISAAILGSDQETQKSPRF